MSPVPKIDVMDPKPVDDASFTNLKGTTQNIVTNSRDREDNPSVIILVYQTSPTPAGGMMRGVSLLKK